MHKLAWFSLAVCGLSTAAQADIRIPHYGKVTSFELCGQRNTSCQPSYGTRYMQLSNFTYEGDPDELLGRRFRSLYNSAPCDPAFPAGEWEKRGEVDNTIQLTVEEEQEAKAEVKADIIAILRNFIGIPDDVKANLSAKFDETLARTQVRNFAVRYYTLRPKLAVRDSMMRACVAATPGNQSIVHSLAIVEVNGEWSNKWVGDTLTAYETEGGIEDLSTEGGAAYQKLKTELMKRTVKDSKYVVAIGFEKGTAD
jgi:hypothetical protein